MTPEKKAEIRASCERILKEAYDPDSEAMIELLDENENLNETCEESSNIISQMIAQRYGHQKQIADLQSLKARLVAMLKDLEYINCGNVLCCPKCLKGTGHDEFCSLGNLLKEVEK